VATLRVFDLTGRRVAMIKQPSGTALEGSVPSKPL